MSCRQRVRRTRGEKPRARTRILLPRPGAPARGHYGPKKPRTGVPRRGHCRSTNVQRGYRRVDTFGVCHFSGVVRADSRAFPPTSEERPEARNHGFGFPSCSRGLVFPDGDIAGPNPNTTFDPSLEYSADKVVLFWQPHPIFHRGPLRRLPLTTCHLLARSSTWWPKRPGFSETIEQWGSSCRRLVQANANASVEACATLTPVLGTGRSKTPCDLAPTPNSRRIQP